ncbi:MAG: CHASE3 domain-containing protein, partial [Bryobacteraceae bacterium]
MAEDLLMVIALNMLATRSEQSYQPRPAGFFRPKIEWLLSPEHFNFKLLLGTGVGVSVIVILAITCFLVAYRNQRQASYRAHTIRVIRLSCVIENDIAAVENAQQGYLLTHDVLYSDLFKHRKGLFQSHSEELASVIQENSQQRKRILKMREIVGKWVTSEPLSMQQGAADLFSEPGNAKAALGVPLLDEARDILHSVQREEQIVLSQRVHEQEWAFQSTQVLDFIPRLERAVYEMQKEERGYVLSGDPAFIESYKRATANFYTFQGHLSVLVADSPAQLHELESIRSSLEHWIIRTALPEIEAKRAGQNPYATTRKKGEAHMAHVRRLLDGFAKEQMEVYQVHSAGAARQRILTTLGIGVLCALATVVMIASSCYSFVVSRRQF